jgi:hypothetical protein
MRATCGPVRASLRRISADLSGSSLSTRNESVRAKCSATRHFLSNGAAQESNLPSVGLPRLTGFEDRLGHRARAAPRLA